MINFLSKFVRRAPSKLNWFAKVFNNLANIPSSKDDLFHELLKWTDNQMTFKHFHQKLDQHSVFAGRNILVSTISMHIDPFIITSHLSPFMHSPMHNLQ